MLFFNDDVDDGSDDDSYNIIRGFVDNDSRVTVIRFYKNFVNLAST